MLQSFTNSALHLGVLSEFKNRLMRICLTSCSLSFRLHALPNRRIKHFETPLLGSDRCARETLDVAIYDPSGLKSLTHSLRT